MPSNTKLHRCCSVLYCQRKKGKSISLHSLPQDAIERNQWLKILSIKMKLCRNQFCSAVDNKTTDIFATGTKISLYDVY